MSNGASSGSGGHDQTVNPVMDSIQSGEKPKWWIQSKSSCAKLTADAKAEWEKTSDSRQKLADDVVVIAVEFGHHARGAYSKLEAWGSELEHKLEADWHEAGYDHRTPWQKASAAVKHGWDCCAASAR